MQNGWREELPDPVLVPLAEIRWAIGQLEHPRWVWDLLGDLDEEDDYDE